MARCSTWCAPAAASLHKFGLCSLIRRIASRHRGFFEGSSHERQRSRKTIAPSRVRRRTLRTQRHRVQGPRQGRDGRRLSELRRRLYRLEGEGAANRRQRTHALFHRPSAPPARPRCRGPGDALSRGPMPLIKRIVTSPAFQETVATMGAWYLRLVWHSTRTTIEPADIYETAEQPS